MESMKIIIFNLNIWNLRNFRKNNTKLKDFLNKFDKQVELITFSQTGLSTKKVFMDLDDYHFYADEKIYENNIADGIIMCVIKNIIHNVVKEQYG